MQESPIVLTDAQKKTMQAELNKKKVAFDKKLSRLMLDEDMAVVATIKYTNRGMFGAIDFEPLSEEGKKLMETRLKN